MSEKKNNDQQQQQRCAKGGKRNSEGGRLENVYRVRIQQHVFYIARVEKMFKKIDHRTERFIKCEYMQPEWRTTIFIILYPLYVYFTTHYVHVQTYNTIVYKLLHNNNIT